MDKEPVRLSCSGQVKGWAHVLWRSNKLGSTALEMEEVTLLTVVDKEQVRLNCCGQDTG